jgi:release factor glutamine methyltransferase
MKKGQKLRAEKPKQYQQGWTEFYKLKFIVTEDTLIPRPETELLVDEVIKIADGISQMADSQEQTSPINHQPSTISILDIGTGSGCIAISIAKNLPNAEIIATDISEQALKVAKLNALRHNSHDRVIFVSADLIKDFRKAPDIIVTNLPYIPTARLLHIDPMVTDWEPKVALDGGEDGFELYRKLFTQIEQKKLYPKYLIGEIDYTQAELVLPEVKRRFPNAKVEVKEDLAKMQRYFVIRF